MRKYQLRDAPVGAALAVPTLLLAACGGGTNHGGSGDSTPSSSGSPTAGSVQVAAHAGGGGTHLTDRSGRTLYLFEADHGMSSSCSGPCAAAWPPLTTTGTARATGGASAGTVGTITRGDGSKQVTYDGHPLYYYAGDAAPGETNGQGSTAYGAAWWIVAPSGSAITKTGSGSSAYGRGY